MPREVIGFTLIPPPKKEYRIAKMVVVGLLVVDWLGMTLAS